MSILPPNASALTRHLEQNNSFDSELVSAVAGIATLKTAPDDNLLHWLVWEYGLEEILPYSRDLRKVINDGLIWQRIRGTPESLTTALSWIDINNAVIESEPPGRHFHEYQLATKQIPGDTNIARIINLADLSAPARSKLSRLYHGYDIRKLSLSTGSFGQLLSDHSGIASTLITTNKSKENKSHAAKLSFGRKHQVQTVSDQTQIQGSIERHRSKQQQYLQRPVLSKMILGANNHDGLQARIVNYHQYTSHLTLKGTTWLGSWSQQSWSSAGYVLAEVNHTSI